MTDAHSFIERNRWGWLVLFTSSATLVCCALPILLVTIGLGAVSASLFSTLPFLVALAKHKSLVFSISGLLLMISGWAIFRPNRVCPAEPKLAARCEQAYRFNRRVFWLASGLWAMGFSAAYLALPIWRLFNA